MTLAQGAKGGITPNQLAKRTRIMEMISEAVSLASTASATQLAQCVFPDEGVIEAMWLVHSVVPTVGTKVSPIIVGYRNIAAAIRATQDDTNYFVTAGECLVENAELYGIGVPHAEFTLANNDVKRGDILTISFTGVANTGSVQLHVMWRRTGPSAGSFAMEMPAAFTDTTT